MKIFDDLFQFSLKIKQAIQVIFKIPIQPLLRCFKSAYNGSPKKTCIYSDTVPIRCVMTSDQKCNGPKSKDYNCVARVTVWEFRTNQ